MDVECSDDEVWHAVAAAVLSRLPKELENRDLAQACVGIVRRILGPYSKTVQFKSVDSAVRKALKNIGHADVKLLFKKQQQSSQACVDDWIQRFSSEHLEDLASDQRQQVHLFVQDLSMKYIQNSTQIPANTYESLNAWLAACKFDLEVDLKVQLCEGFEAQAKSHLFACASIRSELEGCSLEEFAEKIKVSKSDQPKRDSSTSTPTPTRKVDPEELLQLLESIHPKAREKFSDWFCVQSPVVQRGVQKELIKVQKGMISKARKVKSKWSGHSLHWIHTTLDGSPYGLLLKKDQGGDPVILGVAKRNDLKKLLHQAKAYW